MGRAPGELTPREDEVVPVEWELPQHSVTIGYAFSLGKYEVTRGEFAVFVRATGHQVAAAGMAGDWRNPYFSQTDRHPVVIVSWHDAKAYVAWLNATTGKKYRLPSEAEWEYAARAGTTTSRYWGDRWRDACRYANVEDALHECSDGHERTAPVGKFQPNGLGLYDMLGNVSEWTDDCWNPGYAGAPSDGSYWQRGDCDSRMARGGSWIYGPSWVRAAYRLRFTSGYRSPSLGFRVARAD